MKGLPGYSALPPSVCRLFSLQADGMGYGRSEGAREEGTSERGACGADADTVTTVTVVATG